MIDKKFEDKLNKLREMYINKRPEESENLDEGKVMNNIIIPDQNDIILPDEEKEEKLNAKLELLTDKLVTLDEKLEDLLANDASADDISELKYYIDAVKNKKLILEQKLELIKNGEFDAARKERVKRQLTDLELKRCKALLGKKDCSKINEKIALKKKAINRLR